MAGRFSFYMSEADSNASGNRIDPNNLFWGCGVVLIVYFASTAVALFGAPDSRITEAIKDFSAMISDGTYDKPRSVMAVVGYVSCIFFTFILYLYLPTFVDKIWNRYYVQYNDTALLRIWFGIHAIALTAVPFFPTWWWITVVLTFFYSLTIVGLRFYGFRSQLELLELADKAALQTELALLTAIFRNYSVKAPLLGGPFIAVLWVSQASRGSFPISGQMLYAGLFASASGLFIAALGMTVLFRIFSGIRTIRERAELKDVDYFRAFLR